MATLLTRNIASMTEMREPHKVLEKSGGEPVAVLKNSALVGYFMPAEAISEEQHRTARLTKPDTALSPVRQSPSQHWTIGKTNELFTSIG